MRPRPRVRSAPAHILCSFTLVRSAYTHESHDRRITHGATCACNMYIHVTCTCACAACHMSCTTYACIHMCICACCMCLDRHWMDTDSSLNTQLAVAVSTFRTQPPHKATIAPLDPSGLTNRLFFALRLPSRARLLFRGGRLWCRGSGGGGGSGGGCSLMLVEEVRRQQRLNEYHSVCLCLVRRVNFRVDGQLLELREAEVGIRGLRARTHTNN